MEKNSPQIELRGIRKFFGNVLANDGVSLSVAGGSIHAIVGENGAGKSTAMKILYGQYGADEGEVLVDGLVRRWRSPAEAIDAGLGMVHQHFMLAETHTALENVLLGNQRFPYLRRGARAAEQRLNALMAEFGLEVPLHEPVQNLSVGEQQRIEILKLLYRDSRVLILDEPTAMLAPGEIEGLFRILRGLASAGRSVLVITHKLKEVMAFADEVTVLRAGRSVATMPVSETSLAALAEWMVGGELRSQTAARPEPQRELVLETRSLRPRERGSRLGAVSFRIHAGDILGIAGVEGNGQTELIRLLLDPRRERGEGEIYFRGEDVSQRDTAWLRSRGMAVFPEDRLREGLMLNADLEENFLLGHQRRAEFCVGPFSRPGAISAAAMAAVEKYDLRPARLDVPAAALSGGNQQKLVVARELYGNPSFLLAAQPTRGVDIGAIEFIHGQIMELRNRGAAVLLVSSDLEEVFKLSDRLLVFYRGAVVGAFARHEYDEARIGALMAGAVVEEKGAP